MANKSLIIGAFSNYNFNQLKPWVYSIEECGFKGDKVMIAVDPLPIVCDELEKNSFKVVKLPRQNIPIHVQRFIHIYEYISQYQHQYKFVITTDVKDVIFQTNPVDWLEAHSIDNDNWSLVAGSESIRYKDEPWGDENLMQSYGPYIHSIFQHKPIYNVGTIGGNAEYVKDLCLNIALNAIGRPIQVCDQAVFNVMIGTQPYLDAVYFAEQKDGWACQAGTVADPTKIEAFRPNLLEPEPVWDNGIVKIAAGPWAGKPFCIVHQYDRVPIWRDHIYKKYGVIQ